MSTDSLHPTRAHRARAEALLATAPFAFVAMVESIPADTGGGPDDGTGRPAGGDAGGGPDAQPYVVPMNFAYEPAAKTAGKTVAAPPAASPATPPDLGCLYLHTGRGRKTAALEHNARVCVAVSSGEVFERGASPCKDGFAFRSVLVEGRATLVQDEAERERALRAIVAKYDPVAASLPFGAKSLAATVVYAVTIERVSYKERPRRRSH